MRPDITINLVGWDMSAYGVPFPTSTGAYSTSRCWTGFTTAAPRGWCSLTNMSLLPMGSWRVASCPW
jgi:hypothetical protein